jgi:hypothetical protein
LTSGTGRPEKIYTWADVWAALLERLQRPPVRIWALMLAIVLLANLPREWAIIGAAIVVAGAGAALIFRRMGNSATARVLTIREDGESSATEGSAVQQQDEADEARER